LHDTLRRTARTTSQSGLSLEARKHNVHGAFAATTGVSGLRILLVDDIATTCATLEEAASALKQSGASRIDAAVLARTPEHSARVSP
jgi:predicted amidophosphoribosyltransferase